MIDYFAHDTKVFKIFPRRKRNGTLVAKRNSCSTKSRFANFSSYVAACLRIFRPSRPRASKFDPRDESRNRVACHHECSNLPNCRSIYLCARQVTRRLYPFHRLHANHFSRLARLYRLAVRKSLVIFSTSNVETLRNK